MKIGVTGLGVYTPAGTDTHTLMQGLWAGESAVAALPAVESLGLTALAGARFAGEITVPEIEPHLLRHVDRVSLMSLHAARQALQQAEAGAAPLPRATMPLQWGCAMGGIGTLDEAYQDLLVHGKRRTRPTTIPYTMPSAPAFHLAHFLGVRGPATTLTVACASSALAIAQGCLAIHSGLADCVLVGGAESMMTPVALRGWQMAQAVCAARPDDPARSCRPFSASRSGFAMAEGAACLVLESEAHAQARGATVLGWVRGFGHTTDALHISRPDTAAQALAMHQALQRGQATPADLCHINAHGTATTSGDPSEAQSILEVLGDAAADVVVSSTKGQHGHLIGAAGALEAIITLLALRHGRLPGNPHATDPDPAFAALNLPVHAVNTSRERRLGLCNSFAFGGVNTALLLESAHV
jgi:3-oxoacyl-[acyl-carrier-protein] synthase II